MLKKAMLLVKDPSGLAALAEKLVSEFQFEILANDVAAEALNAAGVECSVIETGRAADLIEDPGCGIGLLVANYQAVELAGRGFMSWKSGFRAFDRHIVDAIRAAAWAVDRMAVVGKQDDYETVASQLGKNRGSLPQAFRAERAVAALQAASAFDFAVAQYLDIHGRDAPDMAALSGYPKAVRLAWPRAQILAEGENRHQQAALYGTFQEHFEQVAGPALDYASVVTISQAAYLIGEFEKPAVALLAKGRVVGVATGKDTAVVAAELTAGNDLHGMWLVANGGLGEEIVAASKRKGVVGLILPDVTDSEKKIASEGADSSLRVIVAKRGLGYEALQDVRSVVGGVLIQDRDRASINPMEWKVQSLGQPLVDDWEPLVVGAKVARHLESSACVCLIGDSIVAMKSGRTSQEDAWASIRSLGTDLSNSLLVFDEPIVTPDLLDSLKRGGVRVVLCPSGPVDNALQQAANASGLVLLTMPRSLRKL